MEHFSIPSPFPRLAYGNENGKELQGFVSPHTEVISEQREKKLGYPIALSFFST